MDSARDRTYIYKCIIAVWLQTSHKNFRYYIFISKYHQK